MITIVNFDILILVKEALCTIHLVQHLLFNYFALG